MRRLEHSFQEVKDIGVIWVMDEAIKLGFDRCDPDWANMGQGEPEIGEIPGAPSRINHFTIEPEDDRYGPLNGMTALRIAIAAHYNRLFRKGKRKQYTADNVSIAMGGRLVLTQILSVLGQVNLGYKVPEYPAYEDLINYQRPRVTPIRIPASKENNYSLIADELAIAIQAYKLDAFLFSNPCNPTGHVVRDGTLDQYITLGRELDCALIIDEFYSHFIYEHGKPSNGPVSAAAFIDDVNQDQVLIVDGLTKSFRYPGWRLAWVLGPADVIADIGRAASGIAGGPSLPIQRAALQLFEPGRADMETHALRAVFSRKQTIALDSLRANGILCSPDANGTFYIWADISLLPPPLNNADVFFRELLKRKVIVVPGYMFDIHPGIDIIDLDFQQHVRISFGQNEANLQLGLDRISELIQSYQ